MGFARITSVCMCCRRRRLTWGWHLKWRGVGVQDVITYFCDILSRHSDWSIRRCTDCCCSEYSINKRSTVTVVVCEVFASPCKRRTLCCCRFRAKKGEGCVAGSYRRSSRNFCTVVTSARKPAVVVRTTTHEAGKSSIWHMINTTVVTTAVIWGHVIWETCRINSLIPW